MEIKDFVKLVKNFTTEDITIDEGHVRRRCEENDISVCEVKEILLKQNKRLIRITRDRPGTYKLYYRLARDVELKVIINIVEKGKINIRTVKRLDEEVRKQGGAFKISLGIFK